MKEQMKIKDIVNLWKEEKKRYVKQSTYVTYVALVDKHIVSYFGEKEKILDEDIQSFILNKIDEKLTQKTIKDIIMILKMIIKFGSKNNLIEYHEIEALFPTEREKKKLEILSINDQKRLINYLKDNINFKNLGIFICLSTGLRIGEICALKWKDIDIDKKIFIVGKTIQRIYDYDQMNTEIIISEPKTINSYREIPLTSELYRIIKSFKKFLNKEYYVISNDINPIEPRTYRNYFNKILKKLDIPVIKFHGLRHSFATRCIESNCDYKTVSVILGHSSITTTMNLYVHPNIEQKRKVILKMEKLFK